MKFNIWFFPEPLMKVLITGAGGYIDTVLTEMLVKSGHSVSVLNYHTMKPFNEEFLIKNSANKFLLETFEQNLIKTGLYSKVAQSLISNQISLKMLKFDISEPYNESSGTREYMFSRYGLNNQEVYKKIKMTLKEGEL